MSTEKDNLDESIRVITMLQLENGSVVDAGELTDQQRKAYIEFAIHLAAPRIARYQAHAENHKESAEIKDLQHVNEGYFRYPPMMTVKQAAEFLSVGVSTVREMERRWQGRFFPAVRMGSSIRIPRDELKQWVKEGGINKYKDEIAKADAEYEAKKRGFNGSQGRRSISPDIKK